MALNFMRMDISCRLRCRDGIYPGEGNRTARCGPPSQRAVLKSVAATIDGEARTILATAMKGLDRAIEAAASKFQERTGGQSPLGSRDWADNSACPISGDAPHRHHVKPPDRRKQVIAKLCVERDRFRSRSTTLPVLFAALFPSGKGNIGINRPRTDSCPCAEAGAPARRACRSSRADASSGNAGSFPAGPAAC